MITKDEIKHIANLAHLKIGEDEMGLFTKQLSDILNYIDKLKELDTENVTPTAYTIPMKNILREDRVEPSLARDQALANTMEKEDGQFSVPKIIND